MPTTDHKRLEMHAVPNTEGALLETGDKKNRVISSFGRDGTAELWTNYEVRYGPGKETASLHPSAAPTALESRLPAKIIAREILSYIHNTRLLFRAHNIKGQKLIARGQMENVRNLELAVYEGSSSGQRYSIKEDVLRSDYVLIDPDEEEKISTELWLWYCAGGPSGLPGYIHDVIKEFASVE